MTDAAPTTLHAVLASLPASCYQNPTWKGKLWLARDLALYAGVVVLLWQVDSPWLLVPLWALAGLSVASLFILGHDSAHGALFKSKRLNYVVGQLAMLPSLHLYEAWVFGHNRVHHGHTTREVMDYVWHPVTPEQWAAMSPVAKLDHRLKWSCLGAGLYYMQEIWWQKMVRFSPNDKLAPLVRRDRIVVGGFALIGSAALLIGGSLAYGSLGGALWMWFKVGIVPLVLFNYVIGSVVYIHHVAPEIPWHARRKWNKFKGQIEGTTILRAPAWLNVFFHNILLHVPHHVDMRIPFYHLPEACEVLRDQWGSYIVDRELRWSDYLRATRNCKLFDFERGIWLGYSGEPAALPPASTSAAA